MLKADCFAYSRPLWWERPPFVACCVFIAILALHISVLRLPYFWDEAGYYVPAARDLLLHFKLIPTSTLTNAHPPLVMAWLAAVWKLFGFHPLATRAAMAAIAAFTLTGVFQLARQVANARVALAGVICTMLYPVFFAQSTLAHLDMAAAGLTIWGLASYLRGRHPQAAVWFAFAALAKETAIVAPLALFAWEFIGIAFRDTQWRRWFLFRCCLSRALWLLLPVLPLAAWFAFHRHETGFIFGNPEFIRFNVISTLNPIRMITAFAQRVWQLFGCMNMWLLMLAAIFAGTRRSAALSGANADVEEKSGIAIPVQLIFLLIVISYISALSIIGGAVLARYLLPVYPLAAIYFVSILWRKLTWWPACVAIVCFGFIFRIFINPPSIFTPENNFAYADFVRLHQQAAQYLESHPPKRRILTAWPASDELTKPFLGYVKEPLPILAIENFSLPQITAARNLADNCDTALVFSIKYEPASGLFIRAPLWKTIQKRYFGYHTDMRPEAIAKLLQGEIVWQQRIDEQWIAIIKLSRAFSASSPAEHFRQANP